MLNATKFKKAENNSKVKIVFVMLKLVYRRIVINDFDY